MTDIKVWVQMFFEDGTISEGKRIAAELIEEPETMKDIARGLLRSLNRKDGYMLTWGAGNIMFQHYDFNAYPSKVSEISASEP